VRYTKAMIEPVLRVGQQMSNLCFNLSQSSTVRTEDARIMKELADAWDAAYPRKRTIKEGQK
jgi:hypothetical protein